MTCVPYLFAVTETEQSSKEREALSIHVEEFYFYVNCLNSLRKCWFAVFIDTLMDDAGLLLQMCVPGQRQSDLCNLRKPNFTNVTKGSQKTGQRRVKV